MSTLHSVPSGPDSDIQLANSLREGLFSVIRHPFTPKGVCGPHFGREEAELDQYAAHIDAVAGNLFSILAEACKPISYTGYADTEFGLVIQK